jgi:hypothetical protein
VQSVRWTAITFTPKSVIDEPLFASVLETLESEVTDANARVEPPSAAAELEAAASQLLAPSQAVDNTGNCVRVGWNVRERRSMAAAAADDDAADDRATDADDSGNKQTDP